MKGMRRLWWGLIFLVLISPLGLILPKMLRSGSAWGEWTLEEVQRMLGFIPEGLRKLTDLWLAPIRDYNLKGWQT